MDKSAILKEIQNIHRQGYLNKQSRFLKSWRQRWVVLTNNLLITYKERRVYENPTEVIILKEVVSIKSCDEQQRANTFKVETNENTFYFSSETGMEKEQWIGAIGKAMVKSNNMYEQDN